MDQFLECRYQVLKRPSNLPEIFQQQKRRADETKDSATVFASWLRATEEPTKIRRIEVKLAEGYYVQMIPVWKFLDEQGNAKEISIEPQKSSGRRPWRRALMEGTVNQNGRNWLM
ncbi:hypothetical protein MMC31_001026 [Peltigera leucophlebia]|nr:hypothetical protein [Peltigera leucophlebia]